MFLASVVALLLVACGGESQEQETTTQKGDKLQVAVFQGHGGSETCVWETMAAVGMDSSLEARYSPRKILPMDNSPKSMSSSFQVEGVAVSTST